jgi:hypothetical protein
MSHVETKLRCFSGVIGLAHVVDGAMHLWTRNDVKDVVALWIRERVQNKLVFLSVIVSAEESFIYSARNQFIDQPCVRVYGEIDTHNAAVTDSNIKDAVLDLFTYLKTELNQYKIKVHFQGYSENVSIQIN